MDCPQCGAEVPADDAFCGKCGYAMRDEGPERVDQSRIRVHEEPPAPSSGASQQRIRKHTVMGMPAATPTGTPTPSGPTPPPPAPPTDLSAARQRTRGRTPQKTMLGIPRPDFPEPPDVTGADDAKPVTGPPPVPQSDAPSEQSGRPRARVRYDSANEPYPVVQRRRRALQGLAVLVLLSAAWLAYRYLTLNG